VARCKAFEAAPAAIQPSRIRPATYSADGKYPDAQVAKYRCRRSGRQRLYHPSLRGKHKPPGWNRWSQAEKVAHLLGMGLDRMHDYLACLRLRPCGLAAQAQVIRVIAMVAPRLVSKLPAGESGSVFWLRWLSDN